MSRSARSRAEARRTPAVNKPRRVNQRARSSCRPAPVHIVQIVEANHRRLPVIPRPSAPGRGRCHEARSERPPERWWERYRSHVGSRLSSPCIPVKPADGTSVHPVEGDEFECNRCSQQHLDCRPDCSPPTARLPQQTLEREAEQEGETEHHDDANRPGYRTILKGTGETARGPTHAAG